MRRAVTTTALVLAGVLACSPGDKGDQGGAGDGDATGSDGATDGDGDGDGGGGGDDGDTGSGSEGDGEDGSATGDDGGGDSGGTDGTSDGDTTGGGGDLPDCGFDPGLSFDPLGDVLQLQSADESVCVRLERRDDGPGDAKTLYTLLEMQVGPLGEVSLIDDQADLCWYASHHNFVDWAHGWTGSRHYDVKLKLDDHGGNRTYELHTFEEGPIDPDEPCRPTSEPEDNGPIGDPIELFPYNP
jgi:hypothetical protein